MKSFEEIDAIMLTIPEQWRKRWCENGRCACLGCVQSGNRVVMAEAVMGGKFWGDPEHIAEAAIPADIYAKYKVTREEWELWKQKTLAP